MNLWETSDEELLPAPRPSSPPRLHSFRVIRQDNGKQQIIEGTSFTDIARQYSSTRHLITIERHYPKRRP